MGLSRTKSERTYPEVSKHLGITDCFGSGMATVPSTQTETLDSRRRFHELYRMRGGYTRY